MMKPLSLIIFYCILLLSSVACQAARNTPLSSEISDPVEVTNKLKIDNVYRTLEVNGKQYYAGFMIDSAGLNHPVLIEFDKLSGEQNSWKFDEIISDIFILHSKVSVVLDNGKIYSLLKGEWSLNSRALGKMSLVVFSDAKDRLISCSPSSLSKADTRQGGCESFNPNWQVAFSWFQVQPKVCDDFLYAVTWQQKNNQRLAINLDTGKIVHKAAFSGEDICTPFN